MFQSLTHREGSQRIDGASGDPPTRALLAAVARANPRPTVLDAECNCPDDCLRDHENE